MRPGSSLIFLHLTVQLFQHHSPKRLFSVFPLLLCQRSVKYICVHLFLGFLFCSIDLFVFFCQCQCHTVLKTGSVSLPILFFFINIVLTFWIFCFLRISLLISTKELDGILIGIVFFFFFLHWVFVAARRLSLVVASRGYSLLHSTGFSLQWLLLLQRTGSRARRLQ